MDIFVDVDECSDGSHVCDVNAKCANTNGSHNCSCKEGYIGDGLSCSGTVKKLLLIKTFRLDFLSIVALLSLITLGLFTTFETAVNATLALSSALSMPLTFTLLSPL